MKHIPNVEREHLLTFALNSEALEWRHRDLACYSHMEHQGFPLWWVHVRTWVHPLYCHMVKPALLTTNAMLYTARGLKYHFDDLTKGV